MCLKPFLGGVITASLAVCSLAFGQLKDFDLQDPLENYRKPITRPKAEAKALEGVIDPATYLLGPGDKLEFGVWGGIELIFEVYICPDGTVSITGIGRIHLADITVSDAEMLVIKESSKKYYGSKVSLRLLEIRTMKASISGMIVMPGIYELTSIDRLSTLIFFAGSFIEPAAEGEAEPNLKPGESRKSKKADISEMQLLDDVEEGPSMRRIQITRESGEILNVDYLRYRNTGDLKYNPILRDGDQVHVPLKEMEVGVLHIFGAVKAPGEYEYLEGDQLLDIVEIAGGFRADALISDVLIVRYDGDGTVEIRIDLTDNNGRNTFLQEGDRIFVRQIADYHEKQYVEIKGEVKYPGVYIIEDNLTMLTEIIEACGGFNKTADISTANVARKRLAEIEDKEFMRLLQIPVSEMSDMEYEYFKLKSLRDYPDVVVDFEMLFIENDRSQDIVLRDRDVIEVPTLSLTVSIAGMVMDPGLVKFKLGANYSYYIEYAGGLTWRADHRRIQLIKASGGVRVELNKHTEIEIGDTIFIPERKEINWWEYTKDVLLVVSQIATLIVVVRAL